MADLQISDLPAKLSLLTTDVLGTDAADRQTFKVTGQQVVNLASSSVQIAESQVTNLVTDLAGKQPLNSNLTDISGLTPSLGNYIVGNGTSFIASPAFADAEIKYVAKNGSDSSGNGSILNPFLTISAAMISISDASAIKPYIIKISAGIYSETNIQMKPFVSLVGEHESAVTVNLSGSITLLSYVNNAIGGISNISFSGGSVNLSTAATSVEFFIENCSLANSLSVSFPGNVVCADSIFQGTVSITTTTMYAFGNQYFNTVTITNGSLSSQGDIINSILNGVSTGGNPCNLLLGAANTNSATINLDGTPVTLNIDSVSYKIPVIVSGSPTITLRTISNGVLANRTAVNYIPSGPSVKGHLDGIDTALSGSGTGNVIGPASSTTDEMTSYASTTGKLIGNTGVIVSGTIGNKDITGLKSVTVSQDPISALQLATKQYVDNSSGGGTPTSFNTFISGVQTKTPGTGFTLVPFNTITFDNGGYYNTSTFKYTPLVSGIYYFSFFTAFSDAGVSASTNCSFAFYKNNVQLAPITNQILEAGVNRSRFSLDLVVEMNGTTDFIDVRGNIIGNGGNPLTYLNCELEGFRVSNQSASTGDVSGPSSSLDGNVALYNGTTGKVIKSNNKVRFDANDSFTASSNTSNNAGTASVVIGGSSNIVSATSIAGAVLGGTVNQVDNNFSAIVAGINNTNSGYESAIIAGDGCSISSAAFHALCSGESSQVNGSSSVAMGTQAINNHSGTFVLTDNTASNFTSTANKQFITRFTNHGFNTADPKANFHVSGNGSILLSSNGVIADGNMANNEVNIATSGVNLAVKWKDNTGTVHSVSLPETGNSPTAFNTKVGGVHTITPGTGFNVIPYNTVVFDSDSYYDATNFRYLPLVAGTYCFNFFSLFSDAGVSATTNVIWAFYKNGVQQTPLSNQTLDPGVTRSRGILDLVVQMNGSTDYIDVRVSLTGNGGSPLTLLNGEFQGFRVGNFSGGTGNVSGPVSNGDRNIAIFDGTSGQVIEDSGVNIDTSQNMIGLTSVAVSQDPTAALQLATKQYVDAASGIGSTIQIVYVDKNGVDAVGRGQINRPYLTISYALSQITTASITNKYAIFINPGVYSEANFLIKPFISLIGNSSDNTNTFSNDVTLQFTNTFTFATTSSGDEFILQNFNIDNSSANPIDFTTSASAVILKLNNISSISEGDLNISLPGGALYISECILGNDNTVVEKCFGEIDGSQLGNSFFKSTGSISNIPFLINDSTLGNVNISDAYTINTEVTITNCRPTGHFLSISYDISDNATIVNFDSTSYYVPTISSGSPTINLISISDGLLADRTAVNYTPTNDSVKGHLDGIDTALGAGATPPVTATNQVLCSQDSSSAATFVGNFRMTLPNTVMGYFAGSADVLNDTAGSNVLIGTGTGLSLNATASNNTIVGFAAGEFGAGLNFCTFVGSASGVNTQGDRNTGVGANSIASGTSASVDNTGIGNGTLQVLGVGASNTAVGSLAATSIDSGSNNVCIGYNSGSVGGIITSGSNNILIGKDSQVTSVSASNRIAIGTSASATADNQIMLGNSSHTQIVKNSSATVDLGQLSNPFNNVYANSETLKNTTNQLVLGTTNTTTINSVAPAASRTVNLTDAGSNSNIVLSDTGNTKTLTGPFVYSTTNNTVVGNSSGSSSVLNDSSIGNALFGYATGANLSASSSSNTIVGVTAGQFSQDNINCTYVGYGAGVNDLGLNNIGIGVGALSNGSAGNNNNIALGLLSLSNLTTGIHNLCIGSDTGELIDSGSYNICIGSGSGFDGTSLQGGTANILIGIGAQVDNANANNRISIGTNASATADNQMMLGNNSMTQIVKNPSATVDIGDSSNPFNNIYANAATLKNTTNQIVLGTTNTTTISAVAPPANRTITITDGGDSTTNLMQSNTANTQTRTGPRIYATANNTLVGNGAGSSGIANDTVTGNTMFGVGTGASLSGAATRNVFVGTNAGNAATTSTDLTFVGAGAGQSNTSVNSVGIGTNSISSASGNNNTAVGSSSLGAVSTGASNTAMGRFSGGDISTGSDNTLIGDATGEGFTSGTALTTGSQNTIIGSQADVNSASGTNRIVIGYGAVGNTDNAIMMGNSAITKMVFETGNQTDIGSGTRPIARLYSGYNPVHGRIARTYNSTSTITASDMLDGLILSSTGGTTLTFATASNVFSAIGSPPFDNIGFQMMMLNTSGSNITLAGNTNLTITGSTTLLAGTSRIFYVLVTNHTTPAVVVYG